MRVLLTGATGFIGANLVRALIAQGDEVICLIRKPNRCVEGLNVRFSDLPLLDRPDAIDHLARLLEGVEGIYHVAGLFDPSPGGRARMEAVHGEAALALLKAGVKAGVRRLLYCSSSVTVGFGPRNAPGNEDSPLDVAQAYGEDNPLRWYHDSKLAGEALVKGFGGIETVIVNPDYIIGPWDIRPTSGQLVLSMGRNWVPIYPQGGKCFQGAETCAEGHIRAMKFGKPGSRYLLGSHNLSYREFMEQVAEVVGRPRPVLPLPNLAVRVAGRLGAVLQRRDPHRFAGLDRRVLGAMQAERYRSGARAANELGLPAGDLRKSIEECWAWFCQEGMV